MISYTYNTRGPFGKLKAKQERDASALYKHARSRVQVQGFEDAAVPPRTCRLSASTRSMDSQQSEARAPTRVRDSACGVVSAASKAEAWNLPTMAARAATTSRQAPWPVPSDRVTTGEVWVGNATHTTKKQSKIRVSSTLCLETCRPGPP